MTTKSQKNGNQSVENGFENPKTLLSPFVQIGGQWYVITNWEPGLKSDQDLNLRPLNNREIEWLEPCLEDSIMEVWARLFKDDDAIRDGTEPPNEE